MFFLSNKRFFILLCVMVTIVCLCGCSEEKKKKPIVMRPTTTTDNNDESLRYNTTDTVVVLEINRDNSTVTAKSIENESVYLMNYNGGTEVVGKFGTQMTMAQVSGGDIAKVYFVEGTQKLIKFQLSADIWEYDDITGVSVHPGNNMIKYAGENYKYNSDVVVVDDGSLVDIGEIVKEDVLTVRGVDNTIISIVVEKGHGYLQLTDTKDFEGGVVEVGRYITKLVESDMVIAVPEGTYTFAVFNNGIGGESEITVERGETIPVSLLKYKNKVDKYGLVNFLISPVGATLYIDDKPTSFKEEVQLQYGTHDVRVVADGYAEFFIELTVDTTYTTMRIDLGGKDEQTTTEQQTTDTTDETTKVDSDNKIYLSTPTEGVSVYFDGIYKGKGPVSFEKVTGTHVVILMKSGYKTKIYSIEVPDDNKDFVKVFEALETDK